MADEPFDPGGDNSVVVGHNGQGASTAPGDGGPARFDPGGQAVLQTSYDQVGGWDRDPTIKRLRGAFGEGYGATAQPSVTREDTRSIFTPETQRSMGEHWWGPAANFAGDVIGTGAADVVGAGNTAVTLGNEALRSAGVPAPLLRDLNVEATNLPFAPEARLPPRLVPIDIKNAVRELSAPLAPTLSDLLQRQRAMPSTDPVTNAAISLLRKPTDMPLPPAPFSATTAAPPPRAPAPPGGLLGIPPSPGAPLPGVAPAMTADEMLARSRGYYSPADKQAAQGAMINPGASDSIRGVLTDAVPSDPQKAAAVGSTPLIQLGKDYQPFNGQPMSYDTVMALDRRLTDERQAALRAGNNTLASQLEDAQGRIREKAQGLGPGDTTGDPTALANLAPARQSFKQYIKQSQLEDIQYRASLLPDDKQSAYVRNQARSMLGSDKTRNWSDAERGVLEDAVKSGNIGMLANTGISLIKPITRAAGGGIGGSVFGVPGAIVGGEIGGDVGTTLQAKLRAALSKITLDKVSQQLAQGMPPPPGAP